jgi:hypothetical protein
MKDALTIKTRLDGVIHTAIPQTVEQNTVYQARINVLEWLYNNGNLRTENEFLVKIQSIKEEILAYEFAEDRGTYYKAAQAKLREMEIMK